MYINFLSDAIKRKYGKKLYKLALEGGFTCPNRDGTVGYGGCIFCGGDGSGFFAESGENGIDAQIERAKARVAKKAKNSGYIAYFQSFTNTYAPAEKLRKMFLPIISREDIDVLSIATRPDCLPEDTVAMISELNKIKPIWVELGFQTSNEDTAKLIRRGYDNNVFDDAVTRLKSAGVEVIVHMMIGLPGESGEDALETARYIGGSGADGIKIHLTHVLRGTDLEKEYNSGEFNCLSLEKYTDILVDCIEVLPTEMVIHRITGDGAKRDLIAPLWSGDKKRVLNNINKSLRDRDVEQGRNFKI